MDKKAKSILFKTYWTSAGWISAENRKIDKADFEYAKEKGLMFDPLTISKSELIDKLERALLNISIEKVVDAFLCSLTNKRLDWRSGLASYTNAQRLLIGKKLPDDEYGFGKNKDLNMLNFGRIKWGGMQLDNGLYNWLDLTLLEKEIIPAPTEQDIVIMKSILDTIDKSEIGETPSKLRDRLKDVFNRSQDERHLLIEILASADILKPLKLDRKEPGKHDWTFVLHWRGEDKYNKEAVNRYFGKYLNE